jgi:hypothetical protein
MRRRIFNVTAAISLVLLAVVVAAIFISASVTKLSNDPTARPPILRARSVNLFRGRVVIRSSDALPQPAVMPAVGESYQFHWGGNRMPNTRAIAGIEAGDLPSNGLPGSGPTFYQISFPIWPLVVPFLIVPVWWLWTWLRTRRERRTDSSRAFPVGFEP